MKNNYFVISDWTGIDKKYFYNPRKIFEYLSENKKYQISLSNIIPPEINIHKYIKRDNNDVVFVESKFPFGGNFRAKFLDITVFGERIIYRPKCFCGHDLKVVNNKMLTIIFSHGLIYICYICFCEEIPDEMYEELKSKEISRPIECLVEQIEFYLNGKK